MDKAMLKLILRATIAVATPVIGYTIQAVSAKQHARKTEEQPIQEESIEYVQIR